MKHLALLFSLLMASVSAHAEDGPGSGNGGNLVRIDVLSVINQISQNCDNWNSIRYMQKGDKKVCELLREKIEAVGTQKDRLKILPKLNDDRTGENFPDVPEVHFSESKWTANKDNTIAKIGIVLHEYLGLLGLEKTDEYTISKAVMNELQAASVISSKNPNFMATMGKAAGMIARAKNCQISIDHGDRFVLVADAMDILKRIYNNPKNTKEERAAAKAKFNDAGYELAGLADRGLSGEPDCPKAKKKIHTSSLEPEDSSNSETGPAN